MLGAVAGVAMATALASLVRGKAVLCRLGNALVASATLSELGAAGAVFYLSSFPYRYTTLDVWLPSVQVLVARRAAGGELLRQRVANVTALLPRAAR